MPKKKEVISQEEQSRRFLEAAQRLVDAGELNPTEAEEKLDGFVRHLGGKREPST